MTINHVTINYCGLELDIEFEYAPAEPAVRCYSDYSGYPGCSEHLEITGIMLGEYDLTEFCERHNLFDDLEERMRETR